MSLFSIKDLENLSGIKAHTIRIWEQRYDFLKPHRTKTNIRFYNNEELKKVLNVALLNKYGYKVSHINRMTDHEIYERILSLNNANAQQEHYINQLIDHMVDMDIERMEELLNNYILGRGIEKAITYLIFPFLEKIGILWATSRINPAQEHLVTNLIRQKLIVGIESILMRKMSNNKILLFLPEGEYHELGLLYIQYLLKLHGINSFYLGANVPFNDAHYIFKQKNIQYCFIHLTSLPANFNLEHYIKQLSISFKDAIIVISGYPTRYYNKKVPANIFIKKSLKEVIAFISAM